MHGTLASCCQCVGAHTDLLTCVPQFDRGIRDRVGDIVVVAYNVVGVALALASAAFDSRFAIPVSTSLMIVFYALLGNISGLPSSTSSSFVCPPSCSTAYG